MTIDDIKHLLEGKVLHKDIFYFKLSPQKGYISCAKRNNNHFCDLHDLPFENFLFNFIDSVVFQSENYAEAFLKYCAETKPQNININWDYPRPILPDSPPPPKPQFPKRNLSKSDIGEPCELKGNSISSKFCIRCAVCNYTQPSPPTGQVKCGYYDSWIPDAKAFKRKVKAWVYLVWYEWDSCDCGEEVIIKKDRGELFCKNKITTNDIKTREKEMQQNFINSRLMSGFNHLPEFSITNWKLLRKEYE